MIIFMAAVVGGVIGAFGAFSAVAKKRGQPNGNLLTTLSAVAIVAVGISFLAANIPITPVIIAWAATGFIVYAFDIPGRVAKENRRGRDSKSEAHGG
ncbi:hypothetical protein [Kineococcus sp. SYSU DK018]|uniref:hypothetical protein n=1 Tax=Kineococcus sp. SYSU DK018 TaxID=3383139 RepID=UPI003D7DFDB2